jgi:signal transduction histidine kinase
VSQAYASRIEGEEDPSPYPHDDDARRHEATFGSTKKLQIGLRMAAGGSPRHSEREFDAGRLPMGAPTRAAACTAAGAVVLLAAGYFWLYASILPYPFEPYGFPGGILIFCVAAAVFGALIISRQPRNGVGWAMVLAALLLSIASDAQLYAIRDTFIAPGSLPGQWLAAWLGSWGWAPGVLLITIPLPLLIPDGRLETRRAKVFGVICLIAIAAPTLLIAPSVFAGTSTVPITSDGQVAGPHSLTHLAPFGPLYGAASLVALAALVRMVVRLRGARGDERQQLKWFAYACGVTVLGILVSAVGNLLAISKGTAIADDPLARATAGIFVASFLAIPVGAGISVLKYRLYDIDLVISRTVVYGIMAAVITALYVGVVVGFGSLVGSSGRNNLLLSVVATALVALAFQPLRGRLQLLANRLVYGKRATPYEVLSAFSEGIGETYADEDVLARMTRLLAEATDATAAQVWVRVGEELRPAASWPKGAAPPDVVVIAGQFMPPMRSQVAVPVRHAGELLGAITLDKRQGTEPTPVEAKLIDDLARQAGLVMRTAGLTESLKQRLEELRTSRKRLVAAQDLERRRLERNLHDGAQQNLVALKVKLGLLRTLAHKDAERTEKLAEELSTDADEALETLRDLARGLYPPLLADKGLGPALEAQARKATVPVVVEDDGVGRYPQEIESAAYFCVLEALQNVQKYAEATTAHVRLSSSDARLRFCVEDDGRGFDPQSTRRGSGLQNMSDRLDALGGRLKIDSTPGRGAQLRGELPAAASA